MSDYQDSNKGTAPPILNDGIYGPQFLSGTGTTEASNLKPFTKDRMHILTVGAAPIRVVFNSTAGGTVVPANGGAIVPANSSLTFKSSSKATYIHIEALDGAAAYTASVWQRE